MALACNLPDIDIVTGLWGSAAYLEHHRGITHALPATPLLAAGLALILSKWPRSQRPLVPTFFVAWLGLVIHIVEDLWTSYGTRALLPFNTHWYSWDWIFIVDPTLLLLLACACFGARVLKRPSANRWAMVGVLAYITLRAGAHSLAQEQARDLVGPQFTLVRTFPDPLALNRWRFLASNPAAFASGSVPAVGTTRSKLSFERTQPDAVVTRAAQDSGLARVFLDFSAFPRLEVRPEGDLKVIVWRDLRFADRRADGFFCEVKVDPSGKVVSERIVF